MISKKSKPQHVKDIKWKCLIDFAVWKSPPSILRTDYEVRKWCESHWDVLTQTAYRPCSWSSLSPSVFLPGVCCNLIALLTTCCVWGVKQRLVMLRRLLCSEFLTKQWGQGWSALIPWIRAVIHLFPCQPLWSCWILAVMMYASSRSCVRMANRTNMWWTWVSPHTMENPIFAGYSNWLRTMSIALWYTSWMKISHPAPDFSASRTST